MSTTIEVCQKIWYVAEENRFMQCPSLSLKLSQDKRSCTCHLQTFNPNLHSMVPISHGPCCPCRSSRPRVGVCARVGVRYASSWEFLLSQTSPSNREAHMKYQVAYRLMHPEYLPATSKTVIDACSHAELETRLAKIMAKWQARGYIVQILRVSQMRIGKAALHSSRVQQ